MADQTVSFFIEKLTIWTWLASVWPRLVGRRVKGRSNSPPRVERYYFVDGSRLATMVAAISAWVIGTSVERLEFRLIDIRDEQELLIRLRISFQDLAKVQQDAIASADLQLLADEEQTPNRLQLFLAKSIAGAPVAEPSSMSHFLYLVQVCAWKIRRDHDDTETPTLFVDRRPWMGLLENYAHDNGVDIVWVRPSSRSRLKGAVLRKIPTGIIDLLRVLRHDRSLLRLRFLMRGQVSPVQNGKALVTDKFKDSQVPSAPKLAVAYYGNLNLSQPDLHSDLFFWQQSPIKGEDMLVTFAIPKAPLDAAKLAELEEHRMHAAALHPAATAVHTVPVFSPARTIKTKPLEAKRGQTLEAAWLQDRVFEYRGLRSFWSDVFDASNVKVWTTWYKYDASHCAVADAIRDLGGVATVYQRAFESHPSPQTTIGADIVFGFSPGVADVETRSHSLVKYHVATGYNGDHRFSLLHDRAKVVRDNLVSHGAKRILSYTDENSSDDPRWWTDHLFTQQNYTFLLEKVLAEPWLGLVIKPKVPNTLRARLGPVSDLLVRAEATGRCHVLDQGAFLGARPPAEAALAADIAIHGHLCAATAGMEAALAGVPTLLIDREGWSVSPLYELGEGQVVFTQWEDLWAGCLQHWDSEKGTPRFGDWSPMLESLDPFRDGRAAERMGTYLNWLLEGFKAGLDRETLMADAAQRYCDAWGNDKVTEINGIPPSSGPVRPLSKPSLTGERLA